MNGHITTARLEEIRDTDAAAGSDLQMCPAAWQHRRELLAHIAALDETGAAQRLLVLELSTMLEPISAGAMSLEELVARMRVSSHILATVAPRVDTPVVYPRSSCGECSYEESYGELVELCAKCKTWNEAQK